MFRPVVRVNELVGLKIMSHSFVISLFLSLHPPPSPPPPSSSLSFAFQWVKVNWFVEKIESLSSLIIRFHYDYSACKQTYRIENRNQH